jgi:hypothetical protein
VSEAVPSVLTAWESFYVIVGSSGAALTGLMFVVITLIADGRRRRSTAEIDTFGTPTIVHFCVALLVAAVISAPWHTLGNVAVAIGALGGGGLAYTVIVIRRAKRQTGYKPVFEDWLFHAALPFLAYLTFLLSGIALPRRPEAALFGVGAAALLLVLIGIHNAWDTVTFLAIAMPPQPDEPAPRDPPVAPPAPAPPSTQPL